LHIYTLLQGLPCGASMKQDLFRVIKDFPKRGIEFYDMSPLLNNCAEFSKTVSQLARICENTQCDRIGAFDARGFLFASAVAYELVKPFFPIRKKGKLPYNTIEQSYGLEYGKDTLAIHTDAVQKGDRVFLIDDVLATGGTMKTGCQLVERLGGNVVGCAVVLELGQLKGRELLKGYTVNALVVK
jgi:adenine phosphoribosyltransferase